MELKPLQLKPLTAKQVRATFALYVAGFDTMRAAAQALGVSVPYVSDILAGKRPVSDRMCQSIGLERIHLVIHASERPERGRPRPRKASNAMSLDGAAA